MEYLGKIQKYSSDYYSDTDFDDLWVYCEATKKDIFIRAYIFAV